MTEKKQEVKNINNAQPTTDVVPVAETGIVLDNFRTLSDIQKSLNKNQLAFIKSTVAKDVKSVEHVLMLVYKAMSIGADLLKGEMIGYTDSKGNLVTISTKDFMLRRAYRTKDVEKVVQEAIYVREQDDGKGVKTKVKCEFWETGATLVGGYALIKRFNAEAVEVTVPLTEYKKDNAIWKNIPETMIKKVALVQALRLAFPDELGGIYDIDELDLGNGAKETPRILLEDGDAKPEENQLRTIEAMGGDVTDIDTKQKAVDKINELKTAQIKNKKGYPRR